ncbi:MAG: hypothetical protein HY756_10220 [Nitrospirae bacterium]|nr:hypothetical protein [Nitrospirota bacterium]
MKTSLKQIYWKALERARQTRRRVIARTLDIHEQLRVLTQFAWYVALGGGASARKTSTKRSILVISYYSQPYRSVYGTQRITKFMKFLLRMGWEVTLLTSTPSHSEEQEPRSEGIPEGVHVVRLSAAPLQSTLSRQGLFVPDDYIRWVRPAAQQAHALVRDRGISVILATAPPYSNLIAGAICAARCGLPFVPDFRDPWSKIGLAWVISRPGLRQLNACMEKALLHFSTRVIITDDLKYIDDYLADSSEGVRKKTVSITNGYDEEDFAGMNLSDTHRVKFTVSYIGSLYDQETFDNILQPFRLWQKSYPDDMEKVEFVYAGSGSEYFREAGPLPFSLCDLGYVSHRESIKLRINSDLQLFSLPRRLKAHLYSGKIFEMLRAGVPILAFTRLDGAAAELISKTMAGIAISPGQHQEAADALKRLFDLWRRGEALCNPDWETIAQYSREPLALKLSSLIEEVVGFEQDVLSTT